MTTKIKNRNLIIGVLIAFAALFAFGWYIGRAKAQNASDTIINALNGKITKYEYTIGELEKTAYAKDQLITEQKQAIAQHIIDKKELKALNLKKVNEVTMLKGKIEILLDSIKHSGVVIHHDDSDDVEWEDAITLPLGFEENTKYYKISGEFDKDAYLSLKIEVPIDILSVWTGIEKGTGKHIATVTLDNPYVKINDILSVKMDIPKQRRISIGAQAGYGLILGKPLSTAPYIGVGISYRLF